MSTTRAPFGLLDPLPDGRLAIEASAGTGKTFTLAALATRFLAETDVTAGDLLIVTFTRAATTELRARVRDRVVTAAAHLAADAPDTDDDLLRHLGAADRDRRRARLERAVTEFDAATISTIHGFAGQVLATLGSAGRAEPDLRLVSDDHDLAWEISADVLARAATQGHPSEDLPTHLTLATLVKVHANTPDLLLTPEPQEAAATSAQHLLRELVTETAAAMAAHRRRAGTRSYGALLTDLRDALAAGGAAADAAASLRARYRVALIDEFQDTDPVQWEIFRRLFAGDDAPATEEASRAGSLVLVGDPKQAIYAFRGANVRTYVHAVASGGDTRTLGTNWRSDGAVLDALEVLLADTTFGDPGIGFTPVGSAPANVHRRLRGPSGEPLAALSLRLALDPSIGRTTKGQLTVADAERAIYADLVAHVRRLLEQGRIPGGSSTGSGSDTEERAVRPSDVAVLVKTSVEATAIQAALIDQGIPAILARGGSVLRSPAATQWRWLLEALARPSDPARARTFALSWFEGRSAAWVEAATDAELAEVQDRLHAWADHLVAHGVHELLRRVWADTHVVSRVLARPDGDRSMTDLEHVAELLRTESGGRASVAGLLAVLDSSPELDPDAEMEGDLASRRVESEAEAVQIMTVWVAKGLEFPIALCPTLWRKRNGEVLYQDPDAQRRALDLAKGSTWPDRAGAAARKRLAAADREGEDLRLLYVALTRAKHQTVAWWTRAGDNDGTALARVLFARHDDGTLDPARFDAPRVPLPEDDLAAGALAPLVDRGAGTIEVRTVGHRPRPTDAWVDPVADAQLAPLALAELDRVLDRSRRRWSFTAITAEADHHPAGTVPTDDPSAGRAGGTDEGEVPVDDDLLFVEDDLATEPVGPAAAHPAAHPAIDPAVEEPGPHPAGGPGPEAQLSLFDPPAAPTPATDTADPATSPLATLPAGAAFGTLVHEVLEHVDFQAADLPATIAEQVDDQLRWRALDLDAGPAHLLPPGTPSGRDRLIDGLAAAVHSPLGPRFGARSLHDVPAADRLDEVSFELVLGEGGHVPTGRELGALVLRHLAADDPYRPWAAGVADGAFEVDLAGHLTGSIDVVIRVTDPGAEPRFVVVDYKTNRLHDASALPTAADYRPEQLVGAMVEHHYPLQALLYAVALHRYLRWRVAGYRPEVHLGGAAYLFLRGMSGPGVRHHDGHPHGVATWSIPPALVTALSDLLHGHATGHVTEGGER